ncbi:beta-glucosidase [Pseudoclavibacter sp. AY1F1]|uniref:glycoside hydrolase family 3 protein n=1 Tax=Pseudoclavibacter sp. AY1F1 TaxID=2080583 RepID=UPI000CE8AC29|nr:glycoside hydrolase family 3 N-terminal domain-containing protein [Pseudoclavibacter sp. AY1F1]PPF43336.1 beta-glucosidase [Pseudoclavibacter sp. AY1F1]
MTPGKGENTHHDPIGQEQLPYRDPSLTADQRADDLVPRLSLEEKVGLLFCTVITIGEPGDHDSPGRFGEGSVRDLVEGKKITHFTLGELPSTEAAVRWQNAVQDLAAESEHGIPVMFASDPRHGFSATEGMTVASGGLSKWPELLGLAAIGDEELFERFGDIVRSEYRAVGISCAIHPQLDLVTDPRWARQLQSFGQDPDLVGRFGAAFIRGMQGSQLGASSVACMPKHFPGGGPQKDGEDPHFPYGKEQVYPGGRFADHLKPFEMAIEAGAPFMMPYYGMPVGLTLDGKPVEEVGFSFNRELITGLLRERMGYDGVVTTDFAIISDISVGGLEWPAKAWGVEDLSPEDRVLRAFDAGIDQLGGETATDVVLKLVQDGRLSEDRIDVSARRVLKVKFELGLFDQAHVDLDEAIATVASPAFLAEGQRAQARSITVLKNQGPLPLAQGSKVYLEGLDAEAASAYGLEVADGPEAADVAILRIGAAFEPRNEYFLEAGTHQGSLDYPQEMIDRVTELAASTPVVLDVYLDRAAILTPLEPHATAIVGNYGASHTALLDALTGRITPEGRLPMELPSSMGEVLKSSPDVPSDTENPLYPVGFGLSY